MAPYNYKPLNHSTDAIRLLRLFYDPVFTNELCCQLIETNLQPEGIPYEALSYTWGSEARPFKITADGSVLRVTENLHTALRHLRLPDEDRLLWIDAICINQDDLQERGHQVNQMRLVYQNAERVLIWLGPSDMKIDEFFRTINASSLRRLEHLPRDFVGATQDKDWYDRCQSVFYELEKRPWFRRVWILQEVASAKEAIIMCGHNSISTRLFVMIPSMFGLAVSVRCQAVLDIMPGYSRRRSWRDTQPDLHTLLIMFVASEATDERDRIYALLGISSDACDSEDLLPDYTKSIHQVVQDTISYVLFHEVLDLSAMGFPDYLNVEFRRDPRRIVTSAWNWAVNTSQDELILMLLGVNTQDLAWKYSEKRALLCSLTTRNSDSRLFKLVLCHGDVNVNVTTEDGSTPLHFAIRNHNLDKVAMLLTRHDIAFRKNGRGDTPICEARDGRLLYTSEMLEAYVACHNTIAGPANGLSTPIERAAPMRTLPKMNHILSIYQGIDVALNNLKSLLNVSQIQYGRKFNRLFEYCALQAGCDHGPVDLTKLLGEESSALATLADAPSSIIRDFILLRKVIYMLSLQHGILFNDVLVVKQCLKHYEAAININIKWVYKAASRVMGIHGNCSTALWAAAALGHEDIVNLLLRKDAVVSARDRLFGLSPYEVAVERNHQSIAQCILDYSERPHLRLSPIYQPQADWASLERRVVICGGFGLGKSVLMAVAARHEARQSEIIKQCNSCSGRVLKMWTGIVTRYYLPEIGNGFQGFGGLDLGMKAKDTPDADMNPIQQLKSICLLIRALHRTDIECTAIASKQPVL
ncbi:Heterokaryon incompatibility protein 6, OR allele [Cytospora mali]|uniref:Heterokaryon incompatibility protein 6, OR allele n=1 Tax=Cytospora mali TaxID=578113 RepID=A0A194W7T0_CYTMA|nr:Heterokaryon incompatibility protein 6, OR allele [Valsa mali]